MNIWQGNSYSIHKIRDFRRLAEVRLRPAEVPTLRRDEGGQGNY